MDEPDASSQFYPLRLLSGLLQKLPKLILETEIHTAVLRGEVCDIPRERINQMNPEKLSSHHLLVLCVLPCPKQAQSVSYPQETKSPLIKNREPSLSSPILDWHKTQGISMPLYLQHH